MYAFFAYSFEAVRLSMLLVERFHADAQQNIGFRKGRRGGRPLPISALR